MVSYIVLAAMFAFVIGGLWILHRLFAKRIDNYINSLSIRQQAALLFGVLLIMAVIWVLSARS